MVQSPTRPLWRSLIAALCVALVAFATLEVASPAHAADACEPAGVTAMADSADATVSTGLAQDETGAPGDSQQQQQQQRHHCCAAHTSTVPLAHAGPTVELAALRLAAHANDDVRDRAPLGLERPPRSTAIA